MVSVRRSVRDTAIDWNTAKGAPETADPIAHNSTNVPAPRARAIRVTTSREQELLTMDVHDPYPTIPRPRLGPCLHPVRQGHLVPTHPLALNVRLALNVKNSEDTASTVIGPALVGEIRVSYGGAS